MAIPLKQSTDSQEIPLGYFLDSSDGDTEETALTIANTDIKLWKQGATTLADKNSGGATHISNGIYYCTLDATDTNTLGSLIVFVHVSGALAVRVECEVMTANRYDSLVAGTDVLHADLTQIGGVTQSADDLKDLVDTGYDPSTHKIQGVVLCDTTTTNSDMRGTDNAALASVCTETRLAELDAANLPTDVANVKTDTAAILLDTSTDGVVVAAGSKTGYALSDAGVDAIHDEVVEGSLTLRQIQRINHAVLAGKSTGGGTSTLTFKDVADTKARVTATVDADGNRTAMTNDGT